MKWYLNKIFYRLSHLIMGVLIRRIHVPMPELLTGAGCLEKLPAELKKSNVNRVLIVTDKGISALGLTSSLIATLESIDIFVTIFDGVQANPTIKNIEDGVEIYLRSRCAGIVAFGGGSPMDCAKLIGARVSNLERSTLQMRGGFKIPKKLPPLYAVPTTAGTGSECTLAAVVTDPENREKFSVASHHIVPLSATLDPELMISLPPHITAHTGMDALTHAVEAYIGKIGTSFTDSQAEKAVEIIFRDLEAVFKNGNDLNLRANMAMASYCAGLAFTRALVGYVHAIAHNLGGLYGVPHGKANAIVLPYILEFSRDSCQEKLARLAVFGKLGDSSEPKNELSVRFIEKIKAMNSNMEIPSKVAELKEEDIPLIAKRALKEGNPGYPVPKLMSQLDCQTILKRLLP